MALAGCFPVVERQYNASTESVPGMRVGVGCHVDGAASVKLAAGVELVIEPPLFPEKLHDPLSLKYSLPTGHTAHFEGADVLIRPIPTGEAWTGTLVGSESIGTDPRTHRVHYDHQPFAATDPMVGGDTPAPGSQARTGETFAYEVQTTHTFPSEFSAQFPDLVIDGTAYPVPNVRLRYGKAVALCGCCGV